METLYIDRKHSKLEVSGARLLVHIAQQRPVFSVPLDQVQRIVVSTGFIKITIGVKSIYKAI